MKNLRFLFAFILAAILSSCLDTEEKIVLNPDNSGNFSMTADMGRVLQMASTRGSDLADPENAKVKKTPSFS